MGGVVRQSAHASTPEGASVPGTKQNASRLVVCVLNQIIFTLNNLSEQTHAAEQVASSTPVISSAAAVPSLPQQQKTACRPTTQPGTAEYEQQPAI
jgi:hypothetical protein